jgi:hypothetical protein
MINHYVFDVLYELPLIHPMFTLIDFLTLQFVIDLIPYFLKALTVTKLVLPSFFLLFVHIN